MLSLNPPSLATFGLRWAGVLARILFYAACICIFCLSVRTAPQEVYFALAVGMGVAFAFGLLAQASAHGCLGVLLLVLPFWGQGVLAAAVCAWLLGREMRLSAVPYQVDLPLALLVLGLAYLLATITSLHLYADYTLLGTVYSAGGLSALHHYIAHNDVLFHRVLYVLGSLWLALCLCQQLRREYRSDPARLRFLLYGLLCGSLISAVVAVLQFLSFSFPGIVPQLLLLNLGPLWLAEQRVAGTSTDPNAYAVVGLLVLPMVISTLRGRGISVVVWCMAVLSGVGLLASGSRTLVLGIFIYSIASLILAARGRKHRRVAWAVLFCTLTLAALTLASTPDVNERLRQIVPMRAAERVLQSIHRDEAYSMIRSRVVFWRIAIRVWQGYPLAGSGLGRFTREQDAAAAWLEYKLEGWKDNANNFYLHVLSEQGIAGAILVLASLASLILAMNRPRLLSVGEYFELDEGRRAGKTARFVLACFLLILMTGPHVHFDEVLFIVFVLLALGLPKDSQSVNRRMLALSVLAGCLVWGYAIFSRMPSYKPRGVYPIEFSEGLRVRWTGKDALLYLCDPIAGLRVRALHPDVHAKPVTVELLDGVSKKLLSVFELRDATWQSVPIPVREFKAAGNKAVPVAIRVDRVWSPSEASGEDARWLGVMVEWPSSTCS